MRQTLEVGQSRDTRRNDGPPAVELTDPEIVDLIRKGDREAFEVLYARYFKRVYGFIDRRMSIRADVEETAQEVFVAIFLSIDNYRGDAPFAAWVFGITRRVIANRFKRKRPSTVQLLEENDESNLSHESSRPSPLENYECQETMAMLIARMKEKLSPEQRLLFQLHHLDDRPISEIALELDKTEDAIKSNLYRARKVLLAR
jgi:RNA polymerase sigma-70 factor (ECF subfamily)